MIGFLKRLRRNEKGNILIITAAAMPLLVGSAGLATDTIQWSLWKRQLQRAADSAAIAGVYDRMGASGVTSGVPTSVTRDLEMNQHTGIALVTAIPSSCPAAASGTTSHILLCPPDATVGGIRRKHQVQVTLSVRKALTFSSMFMSTAPLIEATARAASVPSGDEYCVIGLDPTATAIKIGGSTTVDMGECSLMSNSSHRSEAATNVGSSANSSVVAKSLAAVGGVSFSRRWDVDSYDPGTPAVQDPYGPGSGRELSVPAQTSCDTNLSSVANGADRSTTDAPTGGNRKTVCINGEFHVQGGVTLGAATYVINGGDLRMNASGASLTCNGCTIILTNYSNSGTNPGNLQITGGTLNITPPSSGDYQGIAIYQDRRATDSETGGNEQNQVNGNSNMSIQGVVYTPGRSIKMNGGGSSTAPVCMQVIGRRVTFTGNSYIKIASLCPSSGPAPIAANPVVRLVA